MWSVRFKNSGIFLKYRQIYLEVIGLGSAFISTLQSRIAALNVSVRGSQQLHNGRVDYNINPPRTLCSFSHFSSSLIPLLVVETHTRTHTHTHTRTHTGGRLTLKAFEVGVLSDSVTHTHKAVHTVGYMLTLLLCFQMCLESPVCLRHQHPAPYDETFVSSLRHTFDGRDYNGVNK